MTPSELREALVQAIETLKKDNNEVIAFEGVYAQFCVATDEAGWVCLYSNQYGCLLKANPKRPTQKIARLFYVDMTEKVSQ